MAVLYHLIGNYAQAAAYYEEGFERARQYKHFRTEAYILSGIGDLYTELGAIGAAKEAYTKARELAHQIDFRFLLIYLDLAESAQSRRLGNLSQAKGYLESAAQYVRESKSTYERLFTNWKPGDFTGRWEKQGSYLPDRRGACIRRGGRMQARRSLHLAVASMTVEISRHLATRTAFRLADGLESQHVLVVAAQGGKGI
jgi:tetratricopeptide (TPR) repeat protein